MITTGKDSQSENSSKDDSEVRSIISARSIVSKSSPLLLEDESRKHSDEEKQKPDEAEEEV